MSTKLTQLICGHARASFQVIWLSLVEDTKNTSAEAGPEVLKALLLLIQVNVSG